MIWTEKHQGVARITLRATTHGESVTYLDAQVYGPYTLPYVGQKGPILESLCLYAILFFIFVCVCVFVCVHM